MATIEVGGNSSTSAPSPIQLATWHDDWNGQLAGLTAWAPHPATSTTTFRCTTTTNRTGTRAVVDAPLTTWRDADQGHRHYSVT